MIQGTVILTLTSFVVKVLSAVYRVPYQNLVGDEGFYVYQQIYPIYGIGMTLALTGLPLYLSKVLAGTKTAEEEQKQLPSDTDVTITAYEIFNDRDHTQDVTAVIFDLLDAVKIDLADIE